MRFLVLADKYYPTPNANSICLKRILDEFERLGHRILIVNRSTDEKVNDKNGALVNFFQPKETNWEQCNSIGKKLSYISNRLSNIQRWPRVHKTFVEKYVDSTNQLTSLSDIDVIISLCNPYESVEAGYKLKYKYPSKKWVIYNIDTVSDCSMSKIDEFLCLSIEKKALKWELKMFSAADVIITFKCHKGHYSMPVFKDISRKMIFEDVPLFEPEKFVGSMIYSRDKIKMIYAGKFYPGFRDPKILIDLFCEIVSNKKYEVSVYTTNDFISYLNNAEDNKGEILAHTYVKEQELNDYIADSDILLSIGNRKSNMFPSKIVTYVSYGKPIIHIYQDEKDPVISYLEAYPDKLLIDYRDELKNNKHKIANFIESKHCCIDKNKLTSSYKESLPSYNADQILLRL